MTLFIQTSNQLAYQALLSAGFKMQEITKSGTGIIYTLWNDPRYKVPDEYIRDCIFTNELVMPVERREKH